ncbi:poly(ADP-ribose) glycohydrolase ARH3 isoform X2 [Ooceraea biroi]|nr:poly(ADP-ribose) glycohydrolase ARH3 isoform X2 [Ooceraea biroi]XP_019887265.1 poly(ADP-ribose) glycohydrolase ARH3 isoform X2 [Ooceraea biroi]
MPYTDDSAMTRALAESLIDKRDLDIVDVAKRFARSYQNEPDRGYGAGAASVLEKLLTVKETDIKEPAKTLFDGLGSYGNGGAMRIAPMALFLYNNYDHLLRYTKEVTEITHTNKLGINGAILQAIAIQQSLCLNPSEELNVSDFIDNLISKMDKIEVDGQPYKERLTIVKNLLFEDDTSWTSPSDEKVIQELGVGIRAIESVPTAIFCFLRAQRLIRGIRTQNPLRRTIQYAITLSGDTDTIASMAGAIAGAFHGYEKFSTLLLSHCEASEEFREFAGKLLDVATSNPLNN